MSVRTYDPKAVRVILGGVPLSGYIDGEFITWEPASERYTKESGPDGDVTRVKQNDHTGRLTVRLKSTSPSNDVLSLLATADRVLGQGVVPVLVQDGNGRTLIAAPACWVAQMPSLGFSKDVGAREWGLDTGPADEYVGGVPTTTMGSAQSPPE